MRKIVRLNSNSSIFNNHPNLIHSTAQGISDVLSIQGYDPIIATGGKSTAQLIDSLESLDFDITRKQINLNQYLGRLASSTNLATTEQADYLLTDLDLYSDGTNFVFGVTLADWQLSVQSIHRFTQTGGGDSMQEKLATHIARHEFAHMAGLNQPSDYTNPDRRGGLYQGHCANLCTMHQIMSSKDAIGLVHKLNGQANAGFCKSCVNTLRNKSRK